MKRLLLILSFLLLCSPVIGQSDDNCYLFVNGDIGEDKSVIDQIVRPLISSFISPLNEVPVEGLSQSKLNSSCYYEVSVTSTDGTLNLSINGTRTEVDPKSRTVFLYIYYSSLFFEVYLVHCEIF